MYQALVLKGSETIESIVELREWFKALWPALSILWAFAFVALFYLYVSPMAAPPVDLVNGLNIGVDKILHIVAHAGLLALPLAFVPNRRLAWIMGGIAIASAFSFEFAQLFVPERCFDLADLTANLVGLVIGARSGRLVHEL